MFVRDRNREDSRILCHSGHAVPGRVLRAEHYSIGDGRVQGKSRVGL